MTQRNKTSLLYSKLDDGFGFVLIGLEVNIVSYCYSVIIGSFECGRQALL